VLAVSFVSLGLRAGAVVAVSIPLVLAVVFFAMAFAGIDLQRISLGALIIALGLLVDDAMITVEMMITRLEHGDDKEQAATFAYTSTAFPMLTGTLATVAGFVPIGFARSAAGEYTFSIFAVVAIALIASWFVAVLFSPLLGVWILKKPKKVHSGEPGRIMRAFRSFLLLAMRARRGSRDATGCQWKALPKDLPPKSTVHGYLDLWNWDGTRERIHHALYVAVARRGWTRSQPDGGHHRFADAKGAAKGGLRSILQTSTRARRSRVVSGTSWSTRWVSC